MHILTRDQVREVDRRAIEDWGMSGLVLMENAGRGVAALIQEHFRKMQIPRPAQVAVCCGAGNNGGDGFVIARHLQIEAWQPRILLFASPEKLSGDAAANYHIARRAGIPIEVFSHDGLASNSTSAEQTIVDALQGADCLVDALLGTGATGDPRPPYAAAIRAINHLRKDDTWILSVDLPSGLDCDTGQAGQPTVRADATATFVGPKPGLIESSARDFVGRMSVVSIGVPPNLIDEVASE